MPLQIQSTLIREDGKGSAVVELVIAAGVGATAAPFPYTQPQVGGGADALGETVFLRLSVKQDHPYLQGLQGDALKRAIEILQGERQRLDALARQLSR